jgi:hypothetical protein
MSYDSVLAGLHERFATVPGLVTRLDYVPTAIHDLPMLYTWYAGGAVREAGQVWTWEWRVGVRLVVRWQDNKEAERELASYVQAIPKAVRQDPQLGGRIPSGQVVPQDFDNDGGWVTVANTTYRTVDWEIVVIEKEPVVRV